MEANKNVFNAPELQGRVEVERRNAPRWVLVVFAGVVVAVAICVVYIFSVSLEQAANLEVCEHFRKIGNALHFYHDEAGYLPSASGPFLKDGKVIHNHRLSWRVAILPFLEEGALYNEFHLNEPWNSSHNLTMLERMPDVFRRPRVDAPKGYTFYRAFVGTGCMARTRRLGNLPAGLSNTPLIAEAADAVPWTKPDELDVRPGRSFPRLGRHYRSGSYILFADGSFSRIWGASDHKVIRRLVDPDILEVFSDQNIQ